MKYSTNFVWKWEECFVWRLNVQVSYKGKTTNPLAGEHCPSFHQKGLYHCSFLPLTVLFYNVARIYRSHVQLVQMCLLTIWRGQAYPVPFLATYATMYTLISLNILALDEAEWRWWSWCLLSCGEGWSHSLPPHHPAPPSTSDHWWLGQEQQGHSWCLDIWCQCGHLEGGIAIVCKCVYMYACIVSESR